MKTMIGEQTMEKQIKYKDLSWPLKMAAVGGFIFQLWITLIIFLFTAGFTYGMILGILG